MSYNERKMLENTPTSTEKQTRCTQQNNAQNKTNKLKHTKNKNIKLKKKIIQEENKHQQHNENKYLQQQNSHHHHKCCV